jgi:acyl-CoA synthetase (AMP-forming)/AMP-acid ligase II
VTPLTTLPRTPAGSVQKYLLREWAHANAAQETA